MKTIDLAISAASRAAIVGGILLVVVALIAILAAIVFLNEGLDKFWTAVDNFRNVTHPHLHLGWLLFCVGTLLVALGFIFASIGIGAVGGLVLFFLWRMNEKTDWS